MNEMMRQRKNCTPAAIGGRLVSAGRNAVFITGVALIALLAIPAGILIMCILGIYSATGFILCKSEKFGEAA